MHDSPGKRLTSARTAKGISLEEAAHATKVRPEKLVALEKEDWGAFPSMAYAKSFLQLYARYLGVDVSQALSMLDSSMPIVVDDYQYLTNAPDRPSETISRGDTYARRGSFGPLSLFIFVTLGALAVLWFIVKTTFERLGTDAEHLGREQTEAVVTPEPILPTPRPKPVMATPVPIRATPAVRFMPPAPNLSPESSLIPPATTPRAMATPELRSTPAPFPALTPARTTSAGTPIPAAISEKDRAFLASLATPLPITEPTHELIIEARKKTWVRVWRDDQRSQPVFDAYVSPEDGELKMQGTRLYVEVSDGDGVKIRKNGRTLAYQSRILTIE